MVFSETTDLELLELFMSEDSTVDIKWMNGSSRTMIKICPIIKRRKIKKVHIQILHPDHNGKIYTLASDIGWNGIDFNSLFNMDPNLVFQRDNPKKIESPVVWCTFFCKEHKSHSFKVYVPRGSKEIGFSTALESFQINWK